MHKVKRNFYELLSVNPNSSQHDIEEGYRQAVKTYSGNSAALYSLYTAEQKEELLAQINEAYETLKDPEKKHRYDSTIAYAYGEEETYEVDVNALREEKDALFTDLEISEFINTARFKRPLVVMDDKEPMVAEQYKLLSAKLEQISQKNNSKSFAITSAVKGEGKSATSINLSYLMANYFKKRTIMVEFDLRKPSTAKDFFDTDDAGGLSEVLSGEIDIRTAVRRIEGTSLYILFSGKTTKKTSELLNSSAIKALLNTLKAEFDYVIIDSPPILPLVDMDIVSRLVDGVVVVVEARKTSRDIVVKAVNSLTSGNIVGIVLNKADVKLKQYYY